MPSSRRDFLKHAATVSCLAASPSIFGESNDALSLQAQIKKTALELGLPGFVAGVVQNGKLDMVQAEGFANLEKQTPMSRDHIFYVASLTKTFTAVMMMQYVQEKKISLDDYLLDYPFLSVGLTPDRLLHSNTRLKHVLSHTSEGTPGDNFVYNGNRYNFVYGVFEKMSGNTHHYDACAQEFRKRIGDPLNLSSTLSGYPVDKADPRIPRIVTAYLLDKAHTNATVDASAPGATTHFPATGLLTTVDDLAKYMIALDQNALLTPESYVHMTQPFVLNDGRHSPYGLGWSTQVIGGQSVHWHYGYGDSFSALLIRIPVKKVSFILLANTGAASAPFLLGYGNLLTSPFAVDFLRSVLPNAISPTDDIYAEVFLKRFIASISGRNTDAPKRLLAQLKSRGPERFQKSDRSMIYLLSELSDTSLDKEMDQLVQAFDGSGDFHPEVELSIAKYYEKTGEQIKYLSRLHQITDRLGYGEEQATREACVRLGTSLLRKGQVEAGWAYLWMAVQYGKTSGANAASLDNLVAKMHT
jgi:CubicO group peptidase (beta-lactamase class C family)